MDWSALRRLVAPVLIVTLLMGLAAPSAMALPQNPTRIYGEWAVDTPSSSEMVVSQESDRLIVEWESFSIGSGESVHFDQAPHQIALNRVTGGALSEIAGSLSAGGQVFLVNPAGVVFGENAYVEVGGLLATSLDLSDSDFLAGRYRFLPGPAISIAAWSTRARLWRGLVPTRARATWCSWRPTSRATAASRRIWAGSRWARPAAPG